MSTLILIYQILFFGTCILLVPVGSIIAFITGPVTWVYGDKKNNKDEYVQDCIYMNNILCKAFKILVYNFIVLAIIFLIYRFV